MSAAIHFRRILASAIFIVIFGLHAGAQDAAPLTLQQMTRKAGRIFAAEVIRVQPAAPPGTTGSVRVSFRVHRAIRGVRTGQIVTITEWAGLWERSNQRYRLGEKVVLFLYPNSRAGLTSPVGGSLGRAVLDARGNVVLAPEQARLWFGRERRLKRLRTAHRLIRFRDFAREVRAAEFEYADPE